MTSRIRRREFMAALGAGLLAAPAIVRAQGQPIVIRAGALKLIHSIAPYFYDQFVPAGYKIEVLPFETPTECKNAVVTKSVDFGAFGIAAALLGAAAGEACRGDRLDLQSRHGHHCEKGCEASPRSRISKASASPCSPEPRRRSSSWNGCGWKA